MATEPPGVPITPCIRAQVEWLKLKSRYDGHDLLDLLRAIRNSFEHLFERTPGAEDETRRRAVVRAMTGWGPAQMDAAHRSREIRAEARPVQQSFSSRSEQCALLTPLVHPLARYRCVKEHVSTAREPQQEGKGG